MWTLAFLGNPLKLGLQSDAELSVFQRVDMFVFVGAYVFYVLMSIILLLNLLIAMLGYTFASVTADAVLEWRVMFAR